MTLFVLISILFGLFFLVSKVKAKASAEARPEPAKAPKRSIAFVSTPPLSQHAPVPRSNTPKQQTPAECWFPPGVPFQLGDRFIPEGMIYVGNNLPPVKQSYINQEPSLINPSLPVESTGSISSERLLPYWPQYKELDPRARAVFLDWLEGGRVDPNVELGVVFLFFYGIERRIIADAAVDLSAKSEVPALVMEVQRLLDIYGKSFSFRRYAKQLILYARLAYGSAPLYRDPLSPTPDGIPQDPSTAVALGQAVRDGVSLSADLALAWYLASEEVRLRTPARRCWEHFVPLFRQRFGRKHPTGIKVARNKTNLKLSYTPASQTFGYSQIPLPVGDLPDVMRLTRPLRAVADLVDECTNELEAYSRFLGKNPAGAVNLQAAALLPAELSSKALEPQIAAVRSALDAVLGTNGMAVAKADLLLDYWPIANRDKMTKREASELMHFLDRLDCGLEPDPRFGGPPLARTMPIVIFRRGRDGDRVTSPSSEYATVALIIHLATLVAAADGIVDTAELKTLERYVETAGGIVTDEKLRLSAHIQWQIASGMQSTNIKKRLAALNVGAREAIAQFVLSVANADGRIDPAEVNVLRRIYSMLGLDPDGVYQALGKVVPSGAAALTGPVSVRPARALQKGYEIPAPPRGSVVGTTVPLDMRVVHQRMQETAQVSALLSGIFNDEEESEAPPPSSAVADQKSKTLQALDARQTKFLLGLKQRSSWAQVELEELADSHSVLLDGTLEAINELAFDNSGEPAVEWGDPVEVNLQVVEELVA